MDDKTKIARVSAAAEKVLAEFPDGLRFVDLIRRIRDLLPELQADRALANYIQWLPRRNPEKFIKPSRGIFQLVELSDLPQKISDPGPSADDSTNKTWNESSFYQPFADYLKNDLDECGKAIVLGGNKFGNKWGTPDVIGVTVPGLRDNTNRQLSLSLLKSKPTRMI